MISSTEYIQLRAFARQDGFLIGCLWTFTIGCLIACMSNPSWSLGGIAGTISTPFITFFRLKNYRDKVLTGYISYRRAFLFLALTSLYASVILAAALYVYFQFIDGGAFLTAMRTNIAQPEIQQAFTQAGMKADDVIIEMAKTRPIDIAFNFFCEGLFYGLLLALILSLFGFKTQKKL